MSVDGFLSIETPYMLITPFYATLLALIFIFLSVRTLRLRHDLKISIGDSGNARIARAMRVHANFAEYAPFSLLLILMLELQKAPWWVIHPLCLCLLAGRLIHAYGVSQMNENFKYRVRGMALTFTTIVMAVTGILVLYLIKFLRIN